MRDKRGDTSLHNTIYFNNIEISQLILQHGCDLSLKNNMGLTAKELVHKYSKYDIVQLIEQYEEVPIKEPIE